MSDETSTSASAATALAPEKLARPGSEIAVKVTPKASRNEVRVSEGQIRVYVTTVPEGGKATAAVQKLLSKWLGVPKTRLELIRGATSRDKVFRVADQP